MPYKDPKRKRAKDAQYYANNTERIKARVAAYSAANSEKIHAYTDANRERIRKRKASYYAANKEHLAQKHHAWVQANGDRIRAYSALYYAANKATIARKARQWLQANRARHCLQVAARRARKYAAKANDLTPAQWQEIKEHYQHRCVYCGKHQQRLTQDHIIPLVAGGSHTVQNVVPACKSCNSKKYTGPPLKPVQPLLFTIAPKRKKAS